MEIQDCLQETDQYFKVQEIGIARALIDARVRVASSAGVRCDTVFYEFARGKMGVTQYSANSWRRLIAYASFKCMAAEIPALSGFVAIESGILDGVTNIAVEKIEHSI